jgi:putative ABC transport system substrate-binding protein
LAHRICRLLALLGHGVARRQVRYLGAYLPRWPCRNMICCCYWGQRFCIANPDLGTDRVSSDLIKGMHRRDFIKLIGGAAASPVVARAQTATKTYRLASLTLLGPLPGDYGAALMKALGERGYIQGQNLELQPFGTAGMPLSRLPQFAQDIAANKFDAAVVAGYPPVAAMKGTGVPTVVGSGAGDPVATGLVTSLARPGGNITGISDDATTLTTKRMGLLQAAKPNLRRVAMLWNKKDLGMSMRYQASSDAAEALGLIVQPLGVSEPDDFNEAFAVMEREPPDAILMVSDALTALNRKRVYEYATAHRLPAIYESDSYVRDGGLMSYGADAVESYTRAASLIDRIFKGAKAADLPFEQPTRYLFVINLKTAKSINLAIPPTTLALADEVIE